MKVYKLAKFVYPSMDAFCVTVGLKWVVFGNNLSWIITLFPQGSIVSYIRLSFIYIYGL